MPSWLTDIRLSFEKFAADDAHARVRRKRFMRSYPGPDRTFRNVDMQPLADRALRIAYGVAEIVDRDRFEDHVGRIRLIFAWGCTEFVQTLPALEDLENSEAVQSPAFLDGEF